MKNTEIEYVAYTGSFFTIEWYYNRRNESQAFNYFSELDIKQKLKLMALFDRICKTGKLPNKTKFRNEGEGIYAFKPQPERFLSFFSKGKKIIVTEGFYKNFDKLPPEIKKRTISMRDDYNKRIEEGTYYVRPDIKKGREHIR